MSQERMTKRVMKEIDMFATHPPPGICCYPKEDRLDQLEAIVSGTEGTPFENGNFKLAIMIPENYPFTPPLVSFQTRIYHPNIDSSGRICLSILKEGTPNGWSAAINLQTLLLSIQQLFSQPGTEDPLVIDISNEYKNDYPLFEKKAREYTLKYAINNEEQGFVEEMQICPEKEKQEVGIEIVMDSIEQNTNEEKKTLFEKEKESRAINEEKLKDADRPKKRFKLGK